MLSRMKIWQKLCVMCLVFCLPILTLLFLLVQEKNISIEFSAKEFRGDAVLKPLSQVLRQALLCQRLSADWLGKRGSKASLEGAQAGMETALSGLATEAASDGADMKIGDKAAALSAQWGPLKAAGLAGPAGQAAAQGAKFSSDAVALVVAVADGSNLTLDPDLDTYYSMDAETVKLPALQDLLSQGLGLADRAMQGKQDEGSLSDFLVWQGRLRDTLDGLQSDLQTARDNNASGALKSALGGLVEEAQQSAQAEMDAVGLLRKAGKKGDRGAVDSAVGKAEEQSFKLWDALVSAEDGMLQLRIQGFDGKKGTALALVALVLALSGLLVYFIIASITRPLKASIEELSKVTAQVASGSQQISSSSQQLADAARPARWRRPPRPWRSWRP